jgi:D-beta-D-heptose 7-phosphate kinase/D-beta-D-heptose 1-phosphate adenosyltransferase
MKIVLITGGFDPIHSGHIAYIQAAKKLGDFLVLGLNSDEWLIRKKGKAFLAINERKIITKNLRDVDMVITFNDDDNSAKKAIYEIRKQFPDDHIIFANGGDRTKNNIPEMDIDDKNISFIFGVGGENKLNSSSWILKNYLTKTESMVE